jgi:hypothetical protein
MLLFPSSFSSTQLAHFSYISINLTSNFTFQTVKLSFLLLITTSSTQIEENFNSKERQHEAMSDFTSYQLLFLLISTSNYISSAHFGL